ncbi:MAG: hypothetical protein Q8P25_04300 [Candidatus Curtissbacteria bacterium]|nr:hypothetical protein [Candidatus Curtissbacteria bacterium]
MVNPKKYWLLFLPIFAFSLFLYLPSLNYYFFQDDWFVLNWVRTGSISTFFDFRTDIIYWRPFSMPILFALAKSLFSLNYQAFHALAFLIFLMLSVVVYNLFLALNCDRKQAIIASFMYTIWSIHYVPLSWFSTTSYILGPLFQCLSFIFFAKGKRAMCYLFFIVGLMSSEFTVVLPVIFLAWSILFKKKYFSFIFPMLLVDAVYFWLRFVLFPVPAFGTYTPVFNFQLINNFTWYVLWAIGLPESFKSMIFPNLPAQSLKVITHFWPITIPAGFIGILIAHQVLTHLKKRLPNYIFGISWFIFGLLPVITITNHSYPMYLSFAGIGFIYIVLSAFKNSKMLALSSLIVFWAITSITNLQFTRTNHWVRNEQAISKAYIDETLKKVREPQQNSAFIFKSANITFSNNHNFTLVIGENNVGQALNSNDAVQVIYRDSSLNSVFLSDQQNIDLPKDINIIEVLPRED